MNKKILIITKNIFTSYDYERFKIEKLSLKYDIYCIDCSNLFFKFINKKEKNIKNYYKVKNILEYISLLNRIKPDLILDQLGFSFTYKTIFLRLYANLKSRCLFYFTGPKKRIPTFSNFKNGFLYSLKHPLKFFILLNNFLAKKIFINFNFYNTIFLLTSNYSEEMIKNMKLKKIIYFHSNDYDNYLLFKNKLNFKHNNYAVFLDENVPDHDDYQIANFKSPIDSEIYYKLMNNFFSEYEKKFNLNVLVAIHPKSNLEEMSKNFSNRKVFIGRTQELILNSKIVFTHCSTSRSYAILYNKPLVYLTSDIISKTWFGKEIVENYKLTGSKLINLNKINFSMIDPYKVNNEKYREYKDRFLKHPKSKNILFENIFSRII